MEGLNLIMDLLDKIHNHYGNVGLWASIFFFIYLITGITALLSEGIYEYRTSPICPVCGSKHHWEIEEGSYGKFTYYCSSCNKSYYDSNISGGKVVVKKNI